ncbi:hypothetical protein SAMN04488029_1964 [Reichenbachiella faecimaris]|uniref:Membrane protein involved in the export of O-antigen and teichoic acid n=1 Tax=Reichenbachiella faecimaris TaxID=692418 RepID=A0A1W2GDK5_REIFA|nr:hypothetical protein [Reichenbachiella faecimaris]SMD34356.1 hypothetical protein SAMN04488029_1964 [Reichenbachiella faecimaris]
MANTWFSNVVVLISSTIAIPIVITRLNVEEINVWFLFSSIVAMSQGVLFGFNGTFTRFIAYSFSGIRINEFNNIIQKKMACEVVDIDPDEFSKIFSLMKMVYMALSAVYLLILMIIAFFALEKPILELDNVSDGWISWSIIVVSTTSVLFFGYYRVFLEGINKVALVQRSLGIVNLVGLGLTILVLILYPTLISIVLIYQIVTLSGALVLVFLGKKEYNKLKTTSRVQRFDKHLFKLVWDSAWKSGITTVIANVLKHISAVLVAQLFTTSQSASFLFTKKIFDILERFTMATFQSKIPVIAKYRALADFKLLMLILFKSQIISYLVYLVGYIGLITIGQDVLSLLNSNVELGDMKMIMLFSFSSFLMRWSGMSLAISNQSNNVIEHLNAGMVAVFFFASLYLLYDILGILVFPMSHIISLIGSMPIIAPMVYKSLHTNFLSYERNKMIPAFIALIVINIIYYLSL